MQKASRAITYDYHSRHNQPQITVKPGEEFLAETELATGGWLHNASDTWTPDKSCALNPTVVIAVEGARPGDLLAVDILEITPEPLGYTGFLEGMLALASRIYPYPYGLNTRTVRIEDGFVVWSDRLRLPVRPMIGTLGYRAGGGVALERQGRTAWREYGHPGSAPWNDSLSAG